MNADLAALCFLFVVASGLYSLVWGCAARDWIRFKEERTARRVIVFAVLFYSGFYFFVIQGIASEALKL